MSPTQPMILVRKDGTSYLSWGPAKGSRPPFRKGNLMAVTHGAYSDRLVELMAVQVAEELNVHLIQGAASVSPTRQR